MARILAACCALLGLTARQASAHGYLAKPSSKSGADMQSYKMPFQDYYIRANWWVDKAWLNGDRQQKPWSGPGQFNYTTAWAIGQQVFHPCGCYNPAGLQYCAGVTLASGFGETTPGHAANAEFPKIDPAVWAPGSQQDTAFNFYANHHGGYLYMLCKKSTLDACKRHLPGRMWEATRAQIFEYSKCAWDCFEENVLDFVPESQTMQYGDREDLTVRVKTVTKGPSGTLPPGSVWRTVPIPDANMVSSGNWPGLGRCSWDAIDPNSFSSDEARQKFVASFGDDTVCDNGPHNHHPREWHFKDKVAVPPSLPDGEYVLSWRWECGIADQLWSNCADVLVASGAGPDPVPQTTPEPEAEAEEEEEPEAEPETTPEPNQLCDDIVGDVPDALPAAWLPGWLGGDQVTCDVAQRLSEGRAMCEQLEVVRKACCFCGGGHRSGGAHSFAQLAPEGLEQSPSLLEEEVHIAPMRKKQSLRANVLVQEGLVLRQQAWDVRSNDEL